MPFCKHCTHCKNLKQERRSKAEKQHLDNVLRIPEKQRIADFYRRFPTPQEETLGRALDHRWKPGRQVVIGPYIADFLIHKYKLVIEADGACHALRKEYDERRDKFIKSKGYSILRLSNTLIDNDMKFILRMIESRLAA